MDSEALAEAAGVKNRQGAFAELPAAGLLLHPETIFSNFMGKITIH